MSCAINRKKHKCYDSISYDSDSSWDDGSGSTWNIRVRPNCNISVIVNHPSPITTTPHDTMTFSDSNSYHLNLSEDLGILPANHTQSEITAKLLDIKLLSKIFNSVNSPLTGKEWQVTAVVVKACCMATENPAHRTSNTLQGVTSVTQSSRFY